jgi:tetratricopeptide (TPR) repeat protein
MSVRCPGPLRRLPRALLPGLLLSLVLPVCAKDKPLSSVADLRYGVALYNYYQNRNLEAMTELMVAQQKGGIQGHGDNPEIMAGGFSMAYGMERHASEIFERLLDANRPQRTRDSAWFYLAQMRYLRGDWPAADQALAKISGEPHDELAPQVAGLRFNLAVQRGEMAAAENILRNNLKSPLTPYMQFNLGAAYSREGEFAQATPFFLELQKLPTHAPEYLALYDKAMTGAGYAALLDKRYGEAVNHFSQVRLDSPLANRALLGYGWAAVEQGDYTLALKPWQQLARRSLIDEYTQEALVAIPYAYEKMGYKNQALQEFRNAEADYLAEIEQLRQVIGQVQGYAIREALNIDRSVDINWLDQAQQQQLSPQLTYLITLFSREDFVGLVRELRDLLAIQNQFREWQGKLDFYSAMLDEREANREQEMDILARQQLDEKIADLETQRDSHAAEVARLAQQEDFLALVDEVDAARLERILRAEKNIGILQRAAWDMGVEVMPAAELEQLGETLRRQKGLMVWRAMEMYDERLWRAKMELAELDRELTSARAAQRRVRDILEQGFDLQPYRQRIAAASEQLLVQSTDIDHAIELSQDALRGKVLLVLEQQQARLQHYLAQSRLSIARLLDQTVSETAPVPAEGTEEGG